MKKQKISIKWSVFIYLLLFTAVTISVLWLCQIVFLDDIYKSVKTKEIEEAANSIIEDIDSESLPDTIDETGTKGICVSVWDAKRKIPLYTHHTISSCAIHFIDMQSFLTLYQNTESSGGSCIQRFMFNPENGKYIGIEGEYFDKSQLKKYEGQLPENIIYTAITENKEGTKLFIMLNSEISPVNATIGTLNNILTAVSILLVVLSIILALIISLRVTRPIVRLTGEAKKLGREDYNARFDENGYREVAQLSEALEHAKLELARVDTLRRELIANVSHDLRTPLTMIGGYSEMMRDIPGENNAENAQVIIDETNRLSSLVNDVLDISKLQSGTENLEIKCFNITDSVKNTLERFSKLCEVRGYTIDFFCQGDAFVVTDEKCITRVIYNLVANAVNHTGNDRNIKVRLLINPQTVRIEVEDSGEGISPENLPLIWERYYKVDKVHKRAAVGSGLGLSIVKSIMDQIGGIYGVTSTEGVGSTFFIEMERVEI